MIDLVDLKRELRVHLGFEPDDKEDLSDDNATLLLNRAYWALLDTFPFREKERVSTFVTVAGKNKYEMPRPFEALRKIIVIEPESLVHKPLERITEDYFERNYVGKDEEQAIPTHYFRTNNYATLFPTPDDVYDMIIRYWTTLSDLDADNSLPEMPRNWHEIVLYGAVARGFRRLGDSAKAAEFNHETDILIMRAVPTESKEEEDSPLAGVEVPIKRDY